MKLIYKKPLIFPTWGIFSGKDAGKTYYRLEDDCVVFAPEKDKLPHHNHIEMTGFEARRLSVTRSMHKNACNSIPFACFPKFV